jgi:hypothetical protein
MKGEDTQRLEKGNYSLLVQKKIGRSLAHLGQDRRPIVWSSFGRGKSIEDKFSKVNKVDQA